MLVDNNITSPSVYKKGRGAQINSFNRFNKNQTTPFFEDAVNDPEILEASKKTQILEVHPKSIVNRVNSPDVPSEWSMNPYQGCEHGCIYCYARTTHEYWGYSAGKDFEQNILIKKNAASLLDQKLSSKSWKASPIMLSGNTDCYQPAERELEITRSVLKVFLKHKHPVGIITKNALVCRDLDILKELASHGLVHVYISITTLDEDLRRVLEPRTSSSMMRLNAIKQLTDAGIPAGVMLAPIIPGLNSDEVFNIAKASKDVGAYSLSYTMVRLNGAVRLIFEDWIRKALPLKANRVMNLIGAAQGGNASNYNFGERMRGKGVIADNIAQQVRLAKKKFGLDKKFPSLNLNKYKEFDNAQLNLFG